MSSTLLNGAVRTVGQISGAGNSLVPGGSVIASVTRRSGAEGLRTIALAGTAPILANAARASLISSRVVQQLQNGGSPERNLNQGSGVSQEALDIMDELIEEALRGREVSSRSAAEDQRLQNNTGRASSAPPQTRVGTSHEIMSSQAEALNTQQGHDNIRILRGYQNPSSNGGYGAVHILHRHQDVAKALGLEDDDVLKFSRALMELVAQRPHAIYQTPTTNQAIFTLQNDPTHFLRVTFSNSNWSYGNILGNSLSLNNPRIPSATIIQANLINQKGLNRLNGKNGFQLLGQE